MKRSLSFAAAVGVATLLIGFTTAWHLRSNSLETDHQQTSDAPLPTSGSSNAPPRPHPSRASVASSTSNQAQTLLGSVTLEESPDGGATLDQAFGRHFKEHGVAWVLEEIATGSIDVHGLSRSSRRRLVTLVISHSTPMQLAEAMLLLPMPDNAVIAATTLQAAKDAEGNIDQRIVIEKYQLLAQSGSSLRYTEETLYGYSNALNRAIGLGLDEVVHYLTENGVAPATGSDPWNICLRSRLCSAQTADSILAAGY